jgi:hypothetical protein
VVSKLVQQHFRYPLIVVEWDDAETSGGWEEPPAELGEAIAITVGFLIRETSKHLLIASSYDSTNTHTNGRIQIPVGMVKTRVVLIDTKRSRKVSSRSSKEQPQNLVEASTEVISKPNESLSES